VIKKGFRKQKHDFRNPMAQKERGAQDSTSRRGWTIGLGTEWVARNWSIFGEWDYLNFGTHNVTFTDVKSGSSQLSVKQSINELKLGINYRFGNPLPGQYPKLAIQRQFLLNRVLPRIGLTRQHGNRPESHLHSGRKDIAHARSHVGRPSGRAALSALHDGRADR
jgi:hypothetical protein